MGYSSTNNNNNNNKQKNIVISITHLAIITSLLSAALITLLFYLTTTPNPSSLCQPSISAATVAPPPHDDLDVALERAASATSTLTNATTSKTVIIVVINRAYVEPPPRGAARTTMLDNFLEGLWVGEGTRELVDSLLVVAVDRAAYERCVFMRLNCYRMDTTTSDGGGKDFGGEKVYMSSGFVEMMWRRTLLLLRILKRGYSFIFTDADVVWLRNPFPTLTTTTPNETAPDLQISTDVFNGDPLSTDNLINTGFYYVRSNNRTISMFETWYARRNGTTMKEQDVLLQMSRDGTLASELGVSTRYLDTDRFSGFCTDSKDPGRVVTVHANCCRTIAAKVGDLKVVMRDWKRWKVLVEHWKVTGRRRKVPFGWSGHFGCWDSWRVDAKVNPSVGVKA